MKILNFFRRSRPNLLRDYRQIARAFTAAQISRMTADWIAQSTSIDAELRSSLVKLRDRSRQLGRDNDYAVNAFRLIQNNVVGSGIGMRSQVKMIRGSGKLDEKTNSQIEEAWARWQRKENCHTAGKLSFQDIERLLIRSVAEAGEVLVRFISQPMGTTRTPLALEIIEPDLLVETYTGRAQNGNRVRMGVELNEWSRPVAYYFYPKHPNDIEAMDTAARTGHYIRVPADEIIHLFISHRPSQTRGYPWLAAPILRLHQMQGYEEAEVIAARASASIMGFITSPEGEPLKDGVENGDAVTHFEPGVFKTLAPGESVEVPQMNRPGGQFDPFIRAMLRGVAAGTGVSYESLSRDYSQATYSSARQALLEDRDNWRVLQSWLISNFHQVVFERWLDRAWLAGEVKLKGFEINPEPFYAVRWLPRGWAWIDPAKEVAAAKEAIKAGLKTQTEIISEAGGDIEELFNVRKRELEHAKRLGLEFDTDPALEKKGEPKLPSSPPPREDSTEEPPSVGNA